MIGKTEGKQLGRVAFIISETLVVMVSIGTIVYSITKQEINIDLINAILLFQGTIFSIVWGATATKKFAPQQKDYKNEGN